MVHDTQHKRKQRYVLLATIRIKSCPCVTIQRDAAGVIRIGDSKIHLKSWWSVAQHLHTPLDQFFLLLANIFPSPLAYNGGGKILVAAVISCNDGHDIIYLR